MVGRSKAPKRDGCTRCQRAPPAPGARSADSGYPDAMPSTARIGALVLAVHVLVAGCTATAGASFDPTGACSTDGKVAGAYPDLEALVPKAYRGAPPETLDSGRNCTPSGLGPLASLGIQEVRFAGGTWTFGAERALVLAVFRTSGLDADDL